MSSAENDGADGHGCRDGTRVSARGEFQIDGCSVLRPSRLSSLIIFLKMHAQMITMNRNQGPEMAAQLEVFKRMVEEDKVTREEVEELRKMYKDMNMDLDQMVSQTEGMEEKLDPQVCAVD